MDCYHDIMISFIRHNRQSTQQHTTNKKSVKVEKKNQVNQNFAAYATFVKILASNGMIIETHK